MSASPPRNDTKSTGFCVRRETASALQCEQYDKSQFVVHTAINCFHYANVLVQKTFLSARTSNNLNKYTLFLFIFIGYDVGNKLLFIFFIFPLLFPQSESPQEGLRTFAFFCLSGEYWHKR